MSAPECLDHVLREGLVAERLRHLAALLVEREAVRQHDVEGRAAAGAAAFEQRRLEPAAVLVGAFQIHHLVVAAVALALDAGEAGEVDRVARARRHGSSRNRTRRRECRRSSRSRRDRIRARGSAAPRPPRTTRRRLPASNAAAMRALTRSSIRISWPPFLTNTAIGTPQARWRLITQSGLADTMPRMRFSPDGRRPARLADGAQRRLAQARGAAGDRLVHGDEPLRRVAEDDRLLRPPRMRVLVLELAARDQRARRDQRVDDRLVGVAWLALVGEHALAGEARRLVGEGAVLVDGVGDARVDMARREFAPARHPQLEVLAAVAGRGVDEARAGVVGDVIAGEEGDIEVIAAARERVRASEQGGRIVRAETLVLGRLSRRSSHCRQACPRADKSRPRAPNCHPAPR